MFTVTIVYEDGREIIIKFDSREEYDKELAEYGIKTLQNNIRILA